MIFSTRAKELSKEWIEKRGLTRTLRLVRTESDLTLRGSLGSASEQRLMESQVALISPLARFELQSLTQPASTIYFRVFLLELRKDQFRSFGLQWPGLVENALQVTTHTIRDAISLDLAIQALSREGSAKILSKPEIAVRAPGEASSSRAGSCPSGAPANSFQM